MSKKRLLAAIDASREKDDVGTGDEKSEPVKEIHAGHTYNSVTEHDGVYSLQYVPRSASSDQHSRLLVGYGDGGIEMLTESKKGVKLSKEIKKHKYGGLAVTCLKFLPEEPHVCLAGTCEGAVHVCSTIDGTCQQVAIEQGNEINCLDINTSGTSFCSAGKDLTVRMYDTETFEVLKTYTGYSYNSPDQSNAGHAQRIFALRYFPDEDNLLVTGGWDNHIKIWDTRTADGVIGTIPGPHICGDSVDIKGRTMLTGSWVARDSLQLWDLGSCSLIENVPVQLDPDGDNGEFIYCCRLCDNGVVLSGGSGTQSLQAFNVDSNQFLGEIKLEHSVQALAVAEGGSDFVFGGVGNKLKFGSLV